MIDSASLAGRHKPDEALAPATYSGANRHVECGDCHNQHWLPSGAVHTAGTNFSSDVLKYTTRVQATYSITPNVPPTFTPRAAGVTSPPSREYEICFKCHSSWAYGATPPNTPEGPQETDESVDFNPNNKSYHPVVLAITNNSYTIPTAANGNTPTMEAPWNTSSHKTMYCTDCHYSDVPADPNGPHGSNQNYLLPTADTEKALCLICHKASVYAPTPDPTTNETGSRFDRQTHGQHTRLALLSRRYEKPEVPPVPRGRPHIGEHEHTGWQHAWHQSGGRTDERAQYQFVRSGNLLADLP